jgi:hypothetical protein
MKTRIFTIVLTALMTLFFVGSAIAMEPGNKRKGKYTYRKVYKSCHQRGEVESPKPHLNPDAKTQAEWESIFDNSQFDEFGCQEEWSNLSEEDVRDIYTYLYEHASDSPTPLKCK